MTISPVYVQYHNNDNSIQDKVGKEGKSSISLTLIQRSYIPAQDSCEPVFMEKKKATQSMDQMLPQTNNTNSKFI